jgi:hypothetical protein
MEVVQRDGCVREDEVANGPWKRVRIGLAAGSSEADWYYVVGATFSRPKSIV